MNTTEIYVAITVTFLFLAGLGWLGMAVRKPSGLTGFGPDTSDSGGHAEASGNCIRSRLLRFHRLNTVGNPTRQCVPLSFLR